MTDQTKAERRAAVAELKSARVALERVSRADRDRGIREETPAYHRANRRVLDAEQHVSWWRR